MPGDRTDAKDAFWQDDIGFVCNSNFTDAQLPGTCTTSLTDFHKTLSESGRLPDLGGAPVASWVLARLAALSAKRFPYHVGQIFGSDGGDYWLQFIAFTPKFQPLGLVSLSGGETAVQIWAQISPASESERVLAAFTETILVNPTDLTRTSLIVVCTDLADPNLWKKMPFIFGWDGKRFLCEHAPEYAVNAEDRET